MVRRAKFVAAAAKISERHLKHKKRIHSPTCQLPVFSKTFSSFSLAREVVLCCSHVFGHLQTHLRSQVHGQRVNLNLPQPCTSPRLPANASIGILIYQ